MTTTEAAQLLGVSNRTILRWCHSGVITATEVPSKIGRAGYRYQITDTALLSALRDPRHSHMRAVAGERRVQRAMDVLNKAACDVAGGK